MDIEELISRLSACMDEGATHVYIKVGDQELDIADDFEGEQSDGVVLVPKART